MAYGKVLSDVIQSSTSNNATTFQDSNGTQVGVLCRAWVVFNGSTAAINASFNVSSVTRNAAGNYTANFTNALPDANYSCAGSAGTAFGPEPGAVAGYVNTSISRSNTSSNFGVCSADSSTSIDRPYTCFIVFR